MSDGEKKLHQTEKRLCYDSNILLDMYSQQNVALELNTLPELLVIKMNGSFHCSRSSF